MRRALPPLLLFLSACPTTPNEPGEPLTLSFVVPRGGEIPPDFLLPYPNELWRLPDGTFDLQSFPGNQPGIFGDLLQIAAEDGAFAQNGGIFFHFEGALNPASLPDPSRPPSTEDSAFLAELLPDGRLGELIPLLIDIKAEGTRVRPDRTGTLMPFFGFSLRRGATYVAVLTSAVRGTDGTPARADADFLEIRAPGAPEDPALIAADALYEPAFSALEEAGLSREEISWATVFQVGDEVTRTFRLADFVDAGGAGVPAPEFLEFPTLSDTFEASGFLLYRGVMPTPRFQEGVPPYLVPESGGVILFDDQGDPIVQAVDPVNVVISIPDAPAPAGGWPVVIYNHGTGGSASSFVGGGSPRHPAAILAAEGFAVVGIDQPLHGSRRVPGTDVNLVTFNPFNLAATRDGFRQAIADNAQLLRILEQGVILDRDGESVPLSQEQIFFMGHSQGSLSGPLFLSWAGQFGRIRAAVFSGSSGGIHLSIVDRLIPLPDGSVQPARDLVAVAIGEDRDALDEFHPALSLVQQVIEGADPLNYAPLLIKEAANPIDILITEGFLDVHTPPRNIEAFATAVGVAPAIREDGRAREVLGLTLQGLLPLSPPFSGNLGVTAALAQFPDDDHFAVFDNFDAALLYGNFLGTALRDGRASVAPYGAQ